MTSAVALVYSAALGMQAVTLPLLALAVHYSKTRIGLLTALSALTQLLARLGTARAMRRVADRAIIVASCVTLALSGLILTFSTSLGVFLVSELVQGVARGMFWTGAQAHVVRSRRKAVGRLATVNFVSSFGQLGGPPLAGALIEHSYALSLDTAAGIGLVSAAAALVGLRRLPLFAVEGPRRRGALWSEPGVKVGCWAAVTAGAWRGLLNSYVPVVLREASESSSMVGLMLAVANGANVAGSGLMGALGSRRLQPAFVFSILASGVGVAFTGVAAGAPVAAAAALAVSGIGAGMLQTLGPAAAATAVGRARRGDAVAIAGGFRAAALFLSPTAIAALLGLLALSPALMAAGALLTLPAVTAWRMSPSRTGEPFEASRFPPRSPDGTARD